MRKRCCYSLWLYWVVAKLWLKKNPILSPGESLDHSTTVLNQCSDFCLMSLMHCTPSQCRLSDVVFVFTSQAVTTAVCTPFTARSEWVGWPGWCTALIGNRLTWSSASVGMMWTHLNIFSLTLTLCSIGSNILIYQLLNVETGHHPFMVHFIQS